MSEQCYFCTQIDIGHCMIRSLHNKHNELVDKGIELIDALIRTPNERCEQKPNQLKRQVLKYKEMVHIANAQENLGDYLQSSSKQLSQLLEYYKYRIFVPSFVHTSCTQTLNWYYYERLKFYYNSVKRKLNMTVQNSDTSNQHLTKNQSQLNNLYNNTFANKKLNANPQLADDNTTIVGSAILKEVDISQSFMAIQRTESRALEDLLRQMNTNKKFDQIQTLKTEECCEVKDQFDDKNQIIDSYQIIDKHQIIHHSALVYDFTKKVPNIQSDSAGYIKYKIKPKKKFIHARSNSKLQKHQIQLDSSSSLKSPLQNLKSSHKELPLFRVNQNPFREGNKLKESERQKNDYGSKKQRYRCGSLNRFQTLTPINNSLEKNPQQQSRLTRYGSMPKVNMRLESPHKTSKVSKTGRRNPSHFTAPHDSDKKLQREQTREASNIRISIKTNRAQKYSDLSSCKKIKASGFEVQPDDNIITIRKKKLQTLKKRSNMKKHQ